MTVRELIARLRKMPQDARVIVNGYEDGYEDIGAPEVTRIRPNANRPGAWWLGAHEIDEKHGSEVAVYIPPEGQWE